MGVVFLYPDTDRDPQYPFGIYECYSHFGVLLSSVSPASFSGGKREITKGQPPCYPLGKERIAISFFNVNALKET